MDLSPYIESLRRALAVAADAGGDDARALAERLTAPLEASVRLALLDALSAAPDEITRERAPRAAELRLRARPRPGAGARGRRRRGPRAVPPPPPPPGGGGAAPRAARPAPGGRPRRRRDRA